MVSRRLLLIATLATAASGFTIAQERAAKPLHIVVYGGGGSIGSRIVAEAVARGHHVTVVDRNPKEGSAPSGVKLVKGDVFDTADVAGNLVAEDVIITAVAVRPTPTRDFYVRMVKSVVHAQRSLKKAAPRFVIVGGASSLELATGKRLVDTLPPTLPDGVKNEIFSMVDALDYMRTVNDVSWTFFSPAQHIAAGTRTGKFRTGGDQLITDANGVSRISIEDYAVAMLDEIEKPHYIDKRFTVGY